MIFCKSLEGMGFLGSPMFFVVVVVFFFFVFFFFLGGGGGLTVCVSHAILGKREPPAR